MRLRTFSSNALKICEGLLSFGQEGIVERDDLIGRGEPLFRDGRATPKTMYEQAAHGGADDDGGEGLVAHGMSLSRRLLRHYPDFDID